VSESDNDDRVLLDPVVEVIVDTRQDQPVHARTAPAAVMHGAGFRLLSQQ
jgi:hypothetical protein